jgi:hypothetical protein
VRSIKLAFLFLFFCFRAQAAGPALAQNCFTGNGGSSTQLYVVTVGSVGGSTGCTANYTVGNALILAYNQNAGSTDRATGNIAVTGATITWHKATSVQSTVFGPPGFFTGIFYACPNEITSPTSAIAITLDMGALMTGITAAFVGEVSGLVTSSCFDAGASQSTCCNGASFQTVTFAVAHAGEFAFTIGTTFNNPATVLGAGCGGWPVCPNNGAYTIPSHGTDVESASVSAIETGVLIAASGSTVSSMAQTSNAGTAQNISTAAFIAPATVSSKHRNQIL